MAHFAKINKNNIVEQVIVADTQEWCEQNLGGVWVQTSYNTYGGKHKEGGEPLRMNYASIGYYYDQEKDAFIPPQTFPSWILNEKTCLWEAPKPKPRYNKNILVRWNEDIEDWEKFTTAEINASDELKNNNINS